MKKSILLLSLLLVAAFINTSAQNGNILLLKDRGVTIRSFTKDSPIQFEFSNRQWITGFIQWIKKDSIQIRQYALQTVMTAYGTYGQDTLRLGNLVLHINEIRAFAKDRGQYKSVFTNGLFFKAAGIGYLGLNIANSLIRKEPVFGSENYTGFIGSAASYFFGKFLGNKNPDFRPIGKRFSVEII